MSKAKGKVITDPNLEQPNAEETIKKPKETPVKDLMVNHHKLGNVKLGDIPKNEMCRMVKDLLNQNNMQKNQLAAANMMLEEIKVGEMERIKGIVMDKINKNKLAMEAATKKNEPNKDLSNS